MLQNPWVSRALFASLMCAIPSASFLYAAPVTITANVLDDANEGFNDPTLGASRLAALNFALGIWGNALEAAYVGETVTIDVQFNGLGGGATGATLGFAGALGGAFVSGNPQGPNTFFNAPIANHLSGSDVFGGSEMTGTFNSDVDGNVVLGSTVFYYGTDGMPPAGTIDFVQVALHEVGHGLGFGGTLRPTLGGNFVEQNVLDSNNGGAGGFEANYINGTSINSFDIHMVRASDGAALSSLTGTERYAAVNGNNIAWNGANGVAANGGSRPEMEGQLNGVWQIGSTYSHLDEAAFATELMSPQSTAGTPIVLSDLTLGIMQDVGWTIAATAVPEPSQFVFLAAIAVFAQGRRRQRS